MSTKMLGKLAVVAAVVSFGVSGVALASPELAQKSGCATCHDMSAKKMGPSYKEISAKYKGKGDAEGAIVEKMKSGKGHPKSNVAEGDIVTLTKWVLAQ